MPQPIPDSVKRLMPIVSRKTIGQMVEASPTRVGLSRARGRQLLDSCLVVLVLFACSGSNGSDGSAAGGSVGLGGAHGGGDSSVTGASGGLVATSGGQSTGGATPSGVTASSGGLSSATGGVANGGAPATGGNSATGGAKPAGGTSNTGGTKTTNPVGGTPTAGGASATGGTVSTGGTKTTGGAAPTGGTRSSGGTGATGGRTGTVGTTATGGASSTSSSTAVVTGPCDIYAAGDSPCVAAHSTVRALYAAYNGNLYQVRRAADKTTKDIGVLSAGGFADSATQDSFCAGTSCTISIIYDQSGKGNHLKSAPAGGAKNTPDNEADAAALKLTVGTHPVYGVHLPTGVGYRNDTTSGIATGDKPESMYMVTSGNYYNNGCCFDYGNAETDNKDDGATTMEAIYFGTCTGWGKGAGSGPWVMADLENGLFAGQSTGTNSSNTPLTSAYVTAMVTGRSGTFALKGGNAQSGTLTTLYDGSRPSGYTTMKKQGAIILGIGGDNSNSAQGNFFEGVMTSGASSNATDDAVQANIVAAGYGH